MRYLVVVLGLLLLVAGLGGIKGKQIASLIAAGKEMQKAGPPPEAVGSARAEEQTWEGTLHAVGSLSPVRGVDVSNDAAGVVSRIAFESGAFVHQGQTLVELDARVERAQLASSRARRELAELSTKRSRSLVQSGSISQSQLDSDEAGLKADDAELRQLEAQIERKVVRAPFTGRLGIRAVNLGQYLTSGTPLTVLEATDSVYVDFTLPQQRLPLVLVGTPVRIAAEGGESPAPAGANLGTPAPAGANLGTPAVEGRVSAIDPAIDATTRTFRIRANVPNAGERLHPGMFVNVSVVLPQAIHIVAIPATAVVHASYGDSVFVVEDKKDDSGNAKVARQQFVRLGETRGDFVGILEGVTAGQEIVTAGAFKLHNGASVVIKGDVKLDPQLAPHPENR